MGALRSLVARVRANPRLAVGIVLAALLVIAWLGWAIYVASDRGVNEGLGVLITWPAIALALVLISLPFIGIYLLVRRLAAGSDEETAATEEKPADEVESTEEDEAEDREAGAEEEPDDGDEEDGESDEEDPDGDERDVDEADQASGGEDIAEPDTEQAGPDSDEEAEPEPETAAS